MVTEALQVWLWSSGSVHAQLFVVLMHRNGRLCCPPCLAGSETSRLSYSPSRLQAALARLAPHPSALQPANLIPALEAALGSVGPHQGSRSWERAVLASPLLIGLLSLSTELLEQPAAAALGPEAPLLVLEVLSHMAPADAADSACRQAQHARMLWRRAHAALGDAADAAGVWRVEQPQLMSPDMIVRYYEAVARAPFGCSPSKSRGLGLLLRAQLHDRWGARRTGRQLWRCSLCAAQRSCRHCSRRARATQEPADPLPIEAAGSGGKLLHAGGDTAVAQCSAHGARCASRGVGTCGLPFSGPRPAGASPPVRPCGC